MTDDPITVERVAELGYLAQRIARTRAEVARSRLVRLTSGQDRARQELAHPAPSVPRGDRLTALLTLIADGQEVEALERLDELAGLDVDLVDALATAGETLHRLAAQVVAGRRG